jgi:hypothetical protein
MIENECCLSLKQIKNELIKLNNQLGNYLKLKEINFEKATGTTYKFKEIITSKTDFIFDKFTHYLIKNEDYDNKIDSLQQSILSYEQLLFKEVDRMKKYDDLPLIVYLREEEDWSWKKIDKTLNYAEDYSKVKYSRYKNNQKNEIDNV